MVELQIALERKIVSQIEALEIEIKELREENNYLRLEIEEYVSFIRGTDEYQESKALDELFDRSC